MLALYNTTASLITQASPAILTTNTVHPFLIELGAYISGKSLAVSGTLSIGAVLYCKKQYLQNPNNLGDIIAYGRAWEKRYSVGLIKKINHQTSSGYTALMSATMSKEEEIVKLLLANKNIDVNLTNTDGDTALMLAVHVNCPAIIKLLQKAPGIDANIVKDGSTALLQAVQTKDAQTLTAVLAIPGVNKNASDSNGNTAVFIALLIGRFDVFSILVDDPETHLNHTNNEGNTVLMEATKYYSKPFVEYLLKKEKLNILQKNKKGKTALRLAAEYENHDIVLLLCSKLRIKIHDPIDLYMYRLRHSTAFISNSKHDLLKVERLRTLQKRVNTFPNLRKEIEKRKAKRSSSAI